MKKVIYGKYRVTDCEHRGDIVSAENYLRALGCKVISSYWDGRDCGEAYVCFTCTGIQFPSIYTEFCCQATFDADINDYIRGYYECVPGKYRYMKKDEFNSLKDNMCNDFSSGFMYRLPLHLFFQREVDFNFEEVIDKCLSYIPGSHVIGYYKDIVDGEAYYNVLISTSYKNLTAERMREGIGDFCLGSHGWLRVHGFYGECRCVHEFVNTHTMCNYEYIQHIIGLINEKKPLFFHLSTERYNIRNKEITCDEYMDDNGNLIPEFFDGSKYILSDPRSWCKL